MKLNVSTTKNDQRFVEGNPKELLVDSDSAVNSILEVCFSHRVNRVLLYSDNFANEFFDLSTGMAGAVLQKFRNYGMRAAIVLSPGLKVSSRFSEVITEENLGMDFRFFSDRDTAHDWLSND